MKLSDLPFNQGEFYIYLEENGPIELVCDGGDYQYRQPVKFLIEHQFESEKADLINPPEYSEVTVYESNNGYLYTDDCLYLIDATEDREICEWHKGQLYYLESFCNNLRENY